MENLIREQCRNSRRSHKSRHKIRNIEALIESCETSIVGVSCTNREFTSLGLSDFAGEEGSEGISLVERFLEDNTLNDTTKPVLVNIGLFNVSPETNNPSSHLDGFFLRELTKTSSSNSSDGHTNEDIPVDFFDFSKGLILFDETLDHTSFVSAEITTGFEDESLAGSLSRSSGERSTREDNKDK